VAETALHDVYYDQWLTNISIGYQNPDYIVPQIVQVVPVDKPTGLIPRYNQSDWFRNQANRRAPGTLSRRGGFTVDQGVYSVVRDSYGFELPDEVRDATMEPYNMDRDGTLYATDKIYMAQEMDFATNLFTTGVWTDATGYVQFNDYGASTPLLLLTQTLDNIEGRIGREGNIIVMGKQVFTTLRWHPDLLDTIKYTQRAILTEDLIASLFGIEKLLVGRGIYTASPEGTPEASVIYQRIWGKHIMVLYNPPAPTLMNPAAVYDFVWMRVPQAGMSYMRRFREEGRELDVLEANSYHDFRVTSNRSGEFLANIVA
jgi:hypothetical protein